MENKTRERKKTDVLERDSWGYAVCFGTVITFIAGIGHVNSFGLVYNDFMTDTRSTAKSLTTAHGVFAIMLAVGGMSLNVMSKRYSLRSGGILGAVIFSFGSFTTILISNTNQLPITFGVLQGIGFGLMVPVCYSTINYYFVRKRTTVMSACKAVQGLIMMWYPQLLKTTMSFYGFRQTLLIIAGISLHAFPGMLVMKRDKHISGKPRTANNIENQNAEHERVDLLHNVEIIHNVSNSNDKIYTKFSKKMRHVMAEMFSVNVLKDPVYCNICIGQSFVNFSDLSFFILQPMLLFEYGYDKTQVATCISICAGADVAGRCALAVISSLVTVQTRLLFFFSTLFTLLIRILILQVREFVWVALSTACLGMLRAWIHISSPLVISNHVSSEDFPGAYALSMLAAGLVNVALSPFIGLLKDVYQDYVPAFYALTVCCLPCLVLWSIEYLIGTRTKTVSNAI